MNRKLLTKIITFTCLIPVTIVSTPLLVIGVIMWPFAIFEMGFSGIYESVINPGKWSIGELSPTAVPLGIWGLFTLWKLARHYLRHDYLPKKMAIVSTGLVAGFISNIQVMINIFSQHRGGDWIGYLLILSLVAGFYFIFLLFASKESLDSDGAKNAASVS